MGYCPRCGENSPLDPVGDVRRAVQRPALRLPADSKIIRLAIDEPRTTMSLGGARFSVERDGDAYVLRLLE